MRLLKLQRYGRTIKFGPKGPEKGDRRDCPRFLDEVIKSINCDSLDIFYGRDEMILFLKRRRVEGNLV